MVKQTRPKDFFIIAHNIRSLYNVGSIFRTADAFGITKIYLTGYTGRPDNIVHTSKIAKSALGAEKWVPWEHCKSPIQLIKALSFDGVKIVALENRIKSTSIIRFRPRFPLALVLGEERRGVSRAILKLCDDVLEIPMRGKKESLNVSVALGVAAFVLTS